MIDIEKNKVNSILIIKLRGIGDVILSTICIKNLLKEFPNAKIDYLTEKPSKEALSNINELNQILVLDRKSNKKKIRTLLDIRKNKYDLIFDFFTNPTTAIMTFLSGAKYRVGFPYRGRKYAYNIYGPSDRATYHSADLHLKCLESVGLSNFDKDLLFSLTKEEIEFAEKVFRENNLADKIVVGICPSGGWQSKKCPPEKFAQFADSVYNKYNCEILILWGPGDLEDAKEIQRNLMFKSFLAPASSIKQMGALISKSSFLIANDSGPMHISAALKVPTIALFGPTNPHLQGPYGNIHETVRLDSLDCINCDLTECPKNQECFREIPEEKILNSIASLIKKNNIKIEKRK